MQNTEKLWNLTWNQILDVHGAIWKSIAIAFGFIFLMSLINSGGHQGWNLLITVLGYAFIWWFGLRPTHMAYSMAGGGIFAALFDRDKSQGVGGGPRILFKVVQQVSYTFLLIGFSLFTWNFSGNLGAFWVTLLGVVILTQTGVADGWRTKIVTGYVALCIIAALWSTFGTYAGRSFDPNTGAALYMVDPTTGRIDSEGRTPAECGIPDTNANPLPESTCYSAETGTKLVPMSQEQALKRNPTALGDSAISAVSTGAASIADSVGKVEMPDISLDSDCPAKPSYYVVPASGAKLRLYSCWEQEFVQVDLRQVGVTDISLTGELAGEKARDFAYFVTGAPGLIKGHARLIFNSTEMKERGIEVLTVYVGPARTESRVDVEGLAKLAQ